VRRVLISLLILLVLLVIADRVSVVVADHAVARQVRTELAADQDPSVHIHGFPFLTQAIRGRYADVGVRIPDVTSGSLRNITVDARLSGVHAPLSDLVGGRIDRVPVDRITGTVTVGYADLARASGVPGLTITPENGALRVSGQVSALGQPISATATARVSAVDGDLVVTADHAQVSGVPATAAAVAAATRLLSFRVSPRQLPLALRITGVNVGNTSLSVAAEAQNVVLRRGLVNEIG
jgi:hypothetical protein